MSIPNQIANSPLTNTENTVYIYSKKLKITYSSLEDLRYYISKLFDQNLNLNEKIYQCELFLKNLYVELYNKGVLLKDHTMVITDPVADRKIFLESLKAAFHTTVNSKKKRIKPNFIKIHKRLLIIALFIKKKYSLKDLFKITFGRGCFYCKILGKKIKIRNHSAIKFKPTKELEEYIVNYLTRKALLSNEGSVYSLKCYLPIILELVMWYSRSFAYIEHKKEADYEMLSKAIKIVDNYYITSPMFLNLLHNKTFGIFLRILN